MGNLSDLSKLQVARKAAGALVVWFLLWAICTVGFPVALLSLALFRTDYLSRVFKMHDRAAAVVLALGDGSKTVSNECGTERRNCIFCRLTDRFVSWLLVQKDHYAEYSGE